MIRFLRTTVVELVSLVVDDLLTVLAALLGLAGMYLLAHHVPDLRAWAGFLMYALVWAGLGLSLARAARR